MSEPTDARMLQVAIIGGGITGLSLAVGLLRRGVSFTIYERASSFRELGAGIGFSPNAEVAMKLLDPAVLHAFKEVAVQNSSDWFQFVDGAHYSSKHEGKLPTDYEEDIVYKIYCGERGYEGCRRSDFLEKLAALIPEDTVKFEKTVVSVVEPDGDGPLVLRFEDGTTAETDVGKFGISRSAKLWKLLT